MKLAKINHFRCSEWDNSSYVWIPDDMSHDEFYDFCQESRTAFLELKRAKLASRPPFPGYTPAYEKFPNETVESVKKDHAEKLKIYNDWEEQNRKREQDFSEFLYDRSNHKILSFYSYEPGEVVDVSWGHNHGMRINYGNFQTETEKGDN